MKKQSLRRLAENEVIFREANIDVKDFLEDIGAQNNTLVPFFCECSHTNCRRRIELSAKEYEGLHRNRRQFIVVDGHEIPKIETIVERRGSYNVVEKVGEIPDETDISTALRRLAF